MLPFVAVVVTVFGFMAGRPDGHTEALLVTLTQTGLLGLATVWTGFELVRTGYSPDPEPTADAETWS